MPKSSGFTTPRPTSKYPPATTIMRPTPEQREMALVVGLAFFLNFFLGGILQFFNPRWGLVITQVAFIAGPVLLAQRWFYLDRRSILPFRRPSLSVLLATVLGTGALNHLLTLAGAWQERVLPTPEDYRLVFENLFVYRGPVDYTLLLATFAIVPAVCEEMLFRGFMQTGLVRIFESAPKGIVFSSIIFAVFHLDPWRLPGVLVLGLFLGYLVHRTRSLLPTMVAHALNNLLSIGTATAGATEIGAPSGSKWTVSAALLLLAASLVLLHHRSD